MNETTDPDSTFHGKKAVPAIMGSVNDLFLAGMETTSSSLVWMSLFMIHHPEVQEKVYQEIKQVKKTLNLEKPKKPSSQLLYNSRF